MINVYQFAVQKVYQCFNGFQCKIFSRTKGNYMLEARYKFKGQEGKLELKIEDFSYYDVMTIDDIEYDYLISVVASKLEGVEIDAVGDYGDIKAGMRGDPNRSNTNPMPSREELAFAYGFELLTLRNQGNTILDVI